MERDLAAILVLGMHRSGTSACTRILNLCGAAVPADLLPPNHANVTGYWEAKSVVALHESILAQAGSAWDDPTEFSAAWFASPEGGAGVDRLVEVLRAEAGDHPLVVMKDPRACRLVPLWRDALARVEREPLALLLVRHPLEVAASLHARDGMPAAQALLLWLEHVLAAEADTRTMRRVVVTFEQVLADWRAAMRRVEAGFGVALPCEGPDVEAEIAGFLDPSLRHERLPEALLETRPDVSAWVRRVYRWHARAASGAEADPADLDRVRQELRDAAVLYAPLLRWDRQHAREQAARIDEQGRQLQAQAREQALREEAQAAREQANARREQELEGQAAALTADLAREQLARAALAARLAPIERSRVWRLWRWWWQAP
jgi:hypothetical protein